MARKVPGSQPGAVIEYVPKVLGNDTDPDPIRVQIKVPSQQEKRDHLVEVMRSVQERGPDGALDFAQIHARIADALARWVVRVDGYSDQSGADIITGADLWERGEHAISGDVYERIEAMLSLDTIEKKDCSTCSTSSPQATTHSDGIVPSAGGEGSRQSETAEAEATSGFAT